MNIHRCSEVYAWTLPLYERGFYYPTAGLVFMAVLVVVYMLNCVFIMKDLHFSK